MSYVYININNNNNNYNIYLFIIYACNFQIKLIKFYWKNNSL